VANLIVTGEQTGDLENTLEKAAQLYQDRFERFAKAIPGVLSVIGILIIGAMVLSMGLDAFSGMRRW